MKLLKKSIPFLCLFTLLNSCGSENTSNTNSSPELNSTPIHSRLISSLKLANETHSNTSLNLASSVGQVSSTNLNSLKYYITSISICRSLRPQGSGYSNPSGCIEVFRGNSNDPLFSYGDPDLLTQEDYIRFADAARTTSTGFVDLMDPESRSSLEGDIVLTSSDIGAYHYGIINWYLPIKVQASISLANGDIYNTQDGITSYLGDMGPLTLSTDVFSETEAPQEAVVVLGNGGSWFRFQNPFIISNQDIQDKTQFALDLTFNPDGLIKAYTPGLGGCGACVLQGSNGEQISVPYISLTPVAHRATEQVRKETYIARINSAADHFDLRVELYSIEGDNRGTIYGVDTATLINDLTSTAVMQFPKIVFLNGSDNNLSFKDYRGSDGLVLSSFTRQSVEGSTFEATLHCSDPSNGGFQFDGCEEGTTQELTFTLDSISTLR